MSDASGWYYAKDGQSFGPMTLDQLQAKLPSVAGQQTLVYGPDTSDWIEARHVSALAGPPPQPAAARPLPSGARTDERSTMRFSARKCSSSR